MCGAPSLSICSYKLDITPALFSMDAYAARCDIVKEEVQAFKVCACAALFSRQDPILTSLIELHAWLTFLNKGDKRDQVGTPCKLINWKGFAIR